MTTVNRNPAGNDWLARLPASPDIYPQKLDLVRGLVLTIEMHAPDYRAASFLDDRIRAPETKGTWLSLARAGSAAERVTDPRPLHFIFHTGHVGSTLVSRLLDETGIVLPLREPLPLRSLAEAHDVLGRPESLLSESGFQSALEIMLRLWARGYDWTRAVVLKATSSAGRIAIPVLRSRPGSCAICLNLGAEAYVATLLAGRNSADDLRGHAPGRIRRLQALCTAPLDSLHGYSPGELAALGWLIETASQRDAAQRLPGRVLALDFDAFLADVSACMARILGHLGLPLDEACRAAVAASPVLKRYSKAPDQAYSSADRDAALRASRRDNAAEIGRAMAWLERLGRSEPSSAAVLEVADAT
jgi:hypothetical protein